VLDEPDATQNAASQSLPSDTGFALSQQQPAPKKSSRSKKTESFSAESGIWNVGDLIFGVYEVKPIAKNVPYAEGGVGIVHRIYHREWDMELAVKSPKPKFFRTEHGKRSYEQEAQTWIELGLHPNIVTCYLVRRIGGIPRLFAEFVPDGSLRDWILDGRLYLGGGEVALRRILDIAIQFAWGLDHAHRQTLLHLDVKPANVMMSGQTAKVSDFGLSQTALGGTDEQQDETESENYITIGMTPGYCSPEQFRTVELIKKQQFDDLPKLTIQTDIWSWAVSIFGMFLGGPPCNKQGGQNARTVFQEFCQRPPSDERPAVPNTVAELLLRCFEEDPAQRPESMEQIADELIQIYRDISGSEFPRARPVNATWTPESINNRAASLLDLNKPDEAAKLFNQAIALQPWHPAVTYNRTILAWRQGQLTDVAAIEQLETLIKMRPKESGAVYALGLAQRERGNLSAALVAFNNALAVREREDVRRAITATEDQRDDEARCLEILTQTDLPDRKVYVDEKGEFILFYGEPLTLYLHSTITGQLRRTFKTPQEEPKEGERFALSSDLLWELYADQGGFVMRRMGTATAALSFQKIHWGRRFSSKKEMNQVVLLDKALIGDAVQNRVEISDFMTKRKYGSLLGHEDDITALAFNTNGQYVLTASDDRTVRLWELPACRCLRTFTIPMQTIDAVYLDPNELFALSSTASGSLRLWSVALLCRSKAFRAPLQLSHVTSAEEVGRQQTEMEQKCNEIRQAVKQKDYAAALEWAEKANKLSGWESARYMLEIEGIGDKIRRHTLRESFDYALCTHTLSGHGDAITSTALSLDANLIASAGQDGEIRVWNIAEQKCVADLEGHHDTVRSIAMTKDAKFLISGSRDGSVRIWNIGTGQPVRTFGERIMTITKIALNPQEKTVAIADGSGSIILWDVLANSVLTRFSCNNGGVQTLRFSRDGHYLVVGGEDGSVAVWDVLTGKGGNNSPAHAFRDHQSPVTATAVSVSMSRCFSAERNGQIVVRNLLTNKQEHVFEGHIGEISGLELLADARFLFTSAKDGTMKVWQVAGSPESSPVSSSIEGHPAAVTAMALEISGRRLVTGGADGVVRAWELVWHYRFPGWQPISAEARSAMRSLLSLYSEDGVKKPLVDETIANRIILEMGYCGFGTIPSETLKQTLNDLLSAWKDV